ncbi:MAG: YkgJ family cysteine cluster protein [Candidatus Thorarchaeota archaeon]
MTEIHNEVLKMVQEINGKCSWCGNCCKDELFALTDSEAPLIARELETIGGVSLVRKHIFSNPMPMNVFGRFFFGFKGYCPFWNSSGCGIEGIRPMTCQLFPLILVALVDNPRLKLRQPFFTVSSPRKGGSCGIDSTALTSIMKRISHKSLYKLVVAQQMLASILLNFKSLAYCFGQPLQRGDERFNPKPDGFFASEDELSDLLMQHYYRKYGTLITKTQKKSPYVNLNSDMAEQLVSDNSIRRANAKVRKRLNHIRNSRPEIFEWREYYGVLGLVSQDY